MSLLSHSPSAVRLELGKGVIGYLDKQEVWSLHLLFWTEFLGCSPWESRGGEDRGQKRRRTRHSTPGLPFGGFNRGVMVSFTQWGHLCRNERLFQIAFVFLGLFWTAYNSSLQPRDWKGLRKGIRQRTINKCAPSGRETEWRHVFGLWKK